MAINFDQCTDIQIGGQPVDKLVIGGVTVWQRQVKYLVRLIMYSHVKTLYYRLGNTGAYTAITGGKNISVDSGTTIYMYYETEDWYHPQYTASDPYSTTITSPKDISATAIENKITIPSLTTMATSANLYTSKSISSTVVRSGILYTSISATTLYYQSPTAHFNYYVAERASAPSTAVNLFNSYSYAVAGLNYGSFYGVRYGSSTIRSEVVLSAISGSSKTYWQYHESEPSSSGEDLPSSVSAFSSTYNYPNVLYLRTYSV